MNNKSYPTVEKFNFILCEDIRQEIGNKLTFIGVYAGGDILFHKDTKDHVLASVAFFFNFPDGEGDYDGVFELIDPENKLIAKQNMGRMKKQKDSGMNFYLVLKGYKVEKFGQYKARITLDGKNDYEATFNIGIGSI